MFVWLYVNCDALPMLALQLPRLIIPPIALNFVIEWRPESLLRDWRFGGTSDRGGRHHTDVPDNSSWENGKLINLPLPTTELAFMARLPHVSAGRVGALAITRDLSMTSANPLPASILNLNHIRIL